MKDVNNSNSYRKNSLSDLKYTISNINDNLEKFLNNTIYKKNIENFKKKNNDKTNDRSKLKIKFSEKLTDYIHDNDKIEDAIPSVPLIIDSIFEDMKKNGKELLTNNINKEYLPI